MNPTPNRRRQDATSIDRNEIARGETLIFTIRVFEQRQGMQLDLTPLTEDFDVLGTRTSSQIRSVNGTVESWTDYIVTLFPLKEGELVIPSISINDTATDAITVTVVNEGPRSNQSSDELYLELELNKESVYVQEQLLFTIRLFYTINGIRNPQFTELEMENTVILVLRGVRLVRIVQANAGEKRRTAAGAGTRHGSGRGLSQRPDSDSLRVYPAQPSLRPWAPHDHLSGARAGIRTRGNLSQLAERYAGAATVLIEGHRPCGCARHSHGADRKIRAGARPQ